MAHILSQLSPEWIKVRDPDNADREDEDEDERGDRAVLRSTLAACARVCRAFSGPALDAQWRVLDDVVVLLKILPHTMTHPDDAPGSEGGTDMKSARLDVLALSPVIDDTAWVKFRGFACRVRELNSGPPKCFIQPDVWSVLATRLQGSPLLPRLQRLHISMNYNDPASFVLCLSPTLRQLSFAVCDDQGTPMTANSEFVQNILSVLSSTEKLPFISSRQVAGQSLPESAEAIAQHLCSIGRLSRLEVLNLAPTGSRIEVPALRALSTLPSLRSLRLLVPCKGEDEDDALSLDGLSTIRHLHLSGKAEDILRIMVAIPPADLRDLRLCFRGSYLNAITRSLGAMKRYIPRELESLECTFCGPIANGPKSLHGLFHPFFKFHDLKYFGIRILMGHDMNIWDNDLRAFGTCWPKLERFALDYWDLPGAGVSRSAARPTITGLIKLTQGCPQLRFLRLLGLTLGELPAVDAIPKERHARLRYFDPGMLVDDEKADLDEVAQVLDSLFPDLADVLQKDVDRNLPRDTVSWDKVQELMGARRAARKLDGPNSILHEALSPEDTLAMISLLLL
ncbi:hypothetical protein GSI_04866 [Ganoderma sinense ZZ0214-1]|uniref:F-box domain-containing protein n=1 Tax=Ganoderma sinense ZZ0214-1 TaxID=1077348 RepID=A0A2G8SG78_9APHY|nr:hypothetical protein GSI_04866 [Ganoderma sinense ZZ0214-1]